MPLFNPSSTSSSTALALIKWWNAQDYGVTGNGTTDDTAAIQTFVDGINAVGGGVAYFPKGTYIITSTITLPRGVLLVGGQGYSSTSTGASERPVEFAWDGAAGGTMFSLSTIGGNRHFMQHRNLFFRRKAGGANAAGTYWSCPDRLDSWSGWTNCQFGDCTGNAIELGNGGINVHLQDLRFDHVAGYAIKWTLTNADHMIMENVSWDNVGQVGGGGILWVDGQTATANEFLRLTVTGGKQEINQTLGVGQAVYLLQGPTTPVQQLFRLSFTGDAIAPASTALTNWTALRVTPATDLIELHVNSCDNFQVVGIPALAGANAGSGVANYKYRQPNLHVYPHGPTWGSLGNSVGQVERAYAQETVGDINHELGRFYVGGKPAAVPVVQKPNTTNYTVKRTFYAGEFFFIDAGASSGVPSSSTTALKIAVCTTAGTVGTLAGVTASSGVSGAATIVVNDTTGLRIHDYISGTNIASNARITFIDYTTNTVTLSGNNTGTVAAGTAISFLAPVFKSTTTDLPLSAYTP